MKKWVIRKKISFCNDAEGEDDTADAGSPQVINNTSLGSTPPPRNTKPHQIFDLARRLVVLDGLYKDTCLTKAYSRDFLPSSIVKLFVVLVL